MSDSKETPTTPVKLPKGARLSRHGNVIQNGTEVRPDDRNK